VSIFSRNEASPVALIAEAAGVAIRKVSAAGRTCVFNHDPNSVNTWSGASQSCSHKCTTLVYTQNCLATAACDVSYKIATV